MRIAMVEDTESDAKVLRDCLSRYSTETGTEYEVEWFSRADHFLSANMVKHYAAVFMDVDMPILSGMEACRKLRKYDSDIVIVFITNLAQYAIEGYEVNALDFVLKPLNYYSFKMKLKRVLDAVRSRSDKSLKIVTDGKNQIVPISELLYIEVERHNLVYHTTMGDFSALGSLKDAESKLDGDCFFRCNYCYLVNLAHISSVDGFDVTVGGTVLQISRNRKKAFLQQLSDFYGKGGQ